MNACDFIEKLRPMLNVYTQSAKQPGNGVGRPSLDDGELSDSGNATRERGSNIEKGGTK